MRGTARRRRRSRRTARRRPAGRRARAPDQPAVVCAITPQHRTEPSILTAQGNAPSVLTFNTGPRSPGTLFAPKVLSPQHRTVPFASTAHALLSPPVASSRTGPRSDGTPDCWPQQRAAPASVTAQMLAKLQRAAAPLRGMREACCTGSRRTQQRTLPDTCSAQAAPALSATWVTAPRVCGHVQLSGVVGAPNTARARTQSIAHVANMDIERRRRARVR